MNNQWEAGPTTDVSHILDSIRSINYRYKRTLALLYTIDPPYVGTK